LYSPAKSDYRLGGWESGSRHPNGGREAMYIGVGTIVAILVIVLLIAFVF
jgi:hypothetical protein